MAQFGHLILLVAVCSSSLGRSVKKLTDDEVKETNCGYQSCHPIKEGFINVHIVPHSHDDVGWLKTVDQYYWGSKTNIQNAGVQYILDSVVEALKKDPNRRFIQVETAFFWKWWSQQHDIVRSQVRKLVQNGQLEFIGGAWSMNDEATTHYQSIIDQFTWGLRKLNDTFGECGRPKIGWQIDPFGHSREMASIFAQLGFDGLLLGRIDYQEKTLRLNTKSAEMIWKGSNNLDDSEIFTGVMYNTYSPPSGFCFDILCSDEPIIDDKKSPDYNVDRRINDFFDYVKNVTNGYATDNVIITMGDDFNYQDAHVWFKNLNKLIYYANERQSSGSKYNLIYSTPSCYVKAVNDVTKGKSSWMKKEDDFFPYASDPHAFWTGYFTSRPTIKRYEREGNNFLQICKQLYALVDLGPEDFVDLNVMREAMGVMQHHDAITGTEKEHVAHDYARILQHGIDECQFIIASALSKIAAPNVTRRGLQDEPIPAINFTSCLNTNTSSCPLSETQKNFVVTIYNPLSRNVSKHVRLPVLGTAYAVTDPDGNSLETQLIPIADQILTIPGRKSEATVELVFVADNIPPLGFKSYYIERKEGDEVTRHTKLNVNDLGNVSFKISEDTGLITEATMNGLTLSISQEFLYYEGFVGNNQVFANRSSGAYIFRPTNNSAKKATDTVKFKVFRGNLITEVHQTFNEWISQIIKIYNTENFIEFDWLVGPIPVGDNGKEIVTRFKSELKSDSVFYTDSNGRELLRRVRNFRPTWPLTLEEEVSGNYYPITSKILLRDEEQAIELAVLTDRAQGGSSLKDGQLELMVHRNCLHDDAFGVGEALLEEAFGTGLVARGSHYLVVGNMTNIAAVERDIAQRKLLSAWTFLSETTETTYKSYKEKYVMSYAGLKRSLPSNVQILTLEPWKGMGFLLRLEHVLEKLEDSVLSNSVTVDLNDLFEPFEIVSINETTLGGNQWLKDKSRLVFDASGNIEDFKYLNVSSISELEEANWVRYYRDNPFSNSNCIKRDISMEDNSDDLKIQLKPMQIRTFVIEIQKK